MRYKLLFLLTLIPAVCLSLYLYMATDLFKKDKIAYVFDSSVAVSRSLSTQTRLAIQSYFDSIKPIVELYDYSNSTFPEVAQNLFKRNSQLKGMVVYQKSAGRFRTLGSLFDEDPETQKFFKDVLFFTKLQNVTMNEEIAFIGYPEVDSSVALGMRIGKLTDPNYLLILTLVESKEILASFDAGGLYQSALVNKRGERVLGKDLSLASADLMAYVGALPEGTAEATVDPKKVELLSYSKLGIGDMVVVSTVEKAKALKAVDVLIKKSALFFIALLASTLIISLIAAAKLTGALTDLFDATQKIASGDFTGRVKVTSSDEVGGLATSFNWMAEEVSRLMTETAQKARMENELATVKTIQETLFPSANLLHPQAQVVGHFQPASECGGDWWSYTLIGNKLYLWIGDATGHGASAALITSAARSAAAIVESMPNLDPAMALKVMNHAINQTSRSKINMTFFLAFLNLDSGEMVYSNASHDPPYVLKASSEKLKKKDLIPLMEVNGARLGEKPDTEYQTATIQLQPGDQIFFYTDGIIDVQNPKGENLGERMFLKNLLQAVNDGSNPEHRITDFIRVMEEYRQGAELIDDVTMFLLRYGPIEEQSRLAA